MDRWNDELYHHGVLGMRWGHRKQEPISVRLKNSNRTVGANRQSYNKSRARLGGAMGAIGATAGAAIGAAAGGGKGALIGAGIGAAASLPFFSKKVNNLRINMADKEYKVAADTINSLKGRSIYEISARKSAKRRMSGISDFMSEYGIRDYKNPR